MSYQIDEASGRPILDWATDFDHADPNYNVNTIAIWSDLRERCPVAHSDRYGGTGLAVSHEDVTAIAYDTEHFSNVGPLVGHFPPQNEPGTLGLTPLTSDPPFHMPSRRPLLPYFSPKNINAMEDEVRAMCRRLLDDIGDAELIDAAGQYAQHPPTIVTAMMLGFPVEDGEKIRGWVKEGFEGVNRPMEERIARGVEIQAYLDKLIEEHRAEPRDDVTTFLINSILDGEPFEHERIRHNMNLLMVAGVDTTWSSIGSSLWYLAQHPDDLARLVREPELWPVAVEELLRVFAPVTMGRKVAKDIDFKGCPMQENDWVLLPFPAANVDPAVWGENAADVVIDRAENRHYAFGLGIHRCLGSNLARLEMRVALEEFVTRFPRFELSDPASVTWSVGQIKGPKAIPIRILERAG